MRKKHRVSRVLTTFIFLVILAGGIFCYARYIEPHRLTVENEVISTDQLPEGVENLRIVLFADIHIGEFFSEEMLQAVVEKINKQEPDLVLFAGDLFDHYVYTGDGQEDEIAGILSLIQAKYGKFAVYGNHDYGGGAYKIFEELMGDAGFEVLVNDRIYLNEIGVNLIGVDELMLGNGNAQVAADAIREDAYNIALCHEGDIAKELQGSALNLFLAGHTHGGQIQIPFYGPLILPPMGELYVEGLYPPEQEQGTSYVYVTTGLGTTKVPFRFLVPPEISVLDIRS